MSIRDKSPSIAVHKGEYEQIYSDQATPFWETLNSPWYSFVRSHLPKLKNTTVLEIACGRGALSCYMSGLGATVCAVDIAETALQIGQEKAIARGLTTQFICGSIYDIPFPDSFFDIVVSCETIEHLEYPSQGLNEMARVIKPGGWLYLTTENYLNLLGLYRLSLWLRGRKFNSGGSIQPVEQPFLYPFVPRLIRSVGAKVISSESYTYQVWFPWTGIYTIRFIENVRALRRLLKCFGRHLCFVTRVEK